MKKLGCLRSLSAKKEKEKKQKRKGKSCDVCGEEFPSEVSLHKHLEGGRCKKMEDMSEKELSRRRVTRARAVTERGEKIFDVEPVEVKSCSGEVAKACGSFVYLGSLTIAKGSSSPEIRRRIKKAGEAFRYVWRFWTMKGLSLKLKGRLYAAFALSVMLYNSEVWNISKGDMEALEAKHTYLMRRVVGNVVKEKEDRLSSQQLQEMLGLESIEKLIRKRKLQWVAHSARRGETDLTWSRMQRELEDAESIWGQQTWEDWKKMGVRTIKQWCEKIEDRGWLSSKLGSRKQKKKKKASGGKKAQEVEASE